MSLVLSDISHWMPAALSTKQFVEQERLTFWRGPIMTKRSADEPTLIFDRKEGIL